jgi:hypothetical protein
MNQNQETEFRNFILLFISFLVWIVVLFNPNLLMKSI